MKIVEYKIAYTENSLSEGLEEKVNVMIKEGWQPLGSVDASLGWQAMVKYSSEDPRPVPNPTGTM